MNKRRAIKKIDAIEEFKNAARGAHDPRRGIAAARAKLPEPAFESAIRWLETAAPRGKRVMGPTFPSTPSGIHRFQPFGQMSLDREFLWAAERISIHAEQIARFLSYRAEISRLTL